MFFSNRLLKQRLLVISYCASVVLGVLCCLTDDAAAQVSQPHRYEKKQKNSDEDYTVIPLKEEGIALFRQLEKFKSSNRLWELTFLDTALTERKVTELEVKERYILIGYETVPGNIYLLFRTGETNRNAFELIEVNASGEETSRHQVKPDFDFRPTHFSKVGQNFVFGGYVNNEPAIFMYDMSTKLMKVLPGFFQKDTELVELRPNVNGTFNTVLIDRGIRGERKLFFKTFNEQGEMLLEDVVPIEENKTLQTGLTSTLEREELIVLGNWGEKNSKQSKGFFSLTIDPFGDQKINYFDFGQLNHYLDYINPKRAEKLKEESKSDADAGRTPGYTNYVMPYRIAETKEGFLMLAEVFTPNTTPTPYYSTQPYYYNPYYYGPPMGYGSMYRTRPAYPYSTSTRTGDIKTNASVVLAVDGKGKVMWDYSVKLDEVEMLSTEQASDFQMVNNRLYILYRQESSLKGKVIQLTDGKGEDISENIKPSETADEIKSERDSDGSVRYWYGNAFYVWGYQTIKNSFKEDRTRDVFYINKITAQ